MASAALRNTTYAFDRFTIDRDDERLYGSNGPVRLGHKAFQVLIMLIENRGRLVTKDALMSSVWDGTIVSEFALTSVIKELRRALGDDARTPNFIESVYGRGYRLLCDVAFTDESFGFESRPRAAEPPAPVPLEPARTKALRLPSVSRPGAPREWLSGLIGALLVTSVLAILPSRLGPNAGAALAAPPACEISQRSEGRVTGFLDAIGA